MPVLHGLDSEGMSVDNVLPLDRGTGGAPCSADPRWLCGFWIHLHGDLLLWCLVPTVQQLLVSAPLRSNGASLADCCERAVPTPNVQCDAATDHLITNATFNISSDLILISIALPMFIRLMLPWRKKIVLILIFSLGFFVILAAILNKYYSFTQPFGAMWTFWYVRESSTAILVANLPFLWTLVRRVFHVSSLDGASRTNSLSPKGTLSRSDKARKSSNAVDPISGRRLSSNGSGDLEMAEARILDRPMGREDLTFEEMLKADSTASTNDSRELPYAGPQFQYSVWAEGPASPPKSPPMKKAVLHERKQSETCRRESLPERRGSAAPLAHSITAGSENSPKSSSFLL